MRKTASRWLFTPRGCAVLYVPRRNQHLIRTTYPTSHGYRPPLDRPIRNPFPPDGKEAFVSLFQFIATTDNSPYYCVPAALRFRKDVCGGEDAVHRYARDIARAGADRVAAMLGTDVMDDGRVSGGLRDCALHTIRLPLDDVLADYDDNSTAAVAVVAWMEQALVAEYDTFVAIFAYKRKMWCRISGQVYLDLGDFEWLGHVLQRLCSAVRAGHHQLAKGNAADVHDDVGALMLTKAVEDGLTV